MVCVFPALSAIKAVTIPFVVKGLEVVEGWEKVIHVFGYYLEMLANGQFAEGLTKG
jgi:hypothetical protein